MMIQTKLEEFEKVGICHYLVADGKICGTKIVPHFRKDGVNDYWFCPKCDGELLT